MAVNIKTILACLESPDPNLRVRAVVLLVKSGDKRAVPFLERAASEDDSPQVRYYARKGIGYLLSKSKGPAPAGAPPKRRAPAPVDAGLLAPEKVEANLVHDDQWTRLQTIRAVEQYKAISYIPLLISRLGSETNRQVLSALLMTIGKVGGEGGVEAILPFLKNEDARVRANAIEAIDATGDHDSLVHLIPFLRDPDNRCRANAVIALKKYGRVNVFKTLEGMLQAKEVWMQDSATYVLGRMGAGNKTFELLQLALTSEYIVVRQQARNVLQTIADRGIERAQSILDRLGSEQQGNGAEQLFSRLEQLSKSSTDMSKSSEQVLTDLGKSKKEGPTGKSPDDILASLQALSSKEEKPEERKGPANPTEQLEQRAEEVFAALSSLSKKDEEDEEAPKFVYRKAKSTDKTQWSGAFEAVSLEDDEEGEEVDEL